MSSTDDWACLSLRKLQEQPHVQRVVTQGAATMIDLSFLTEEEQEIIQQVLKRDAELKKAEEQRIE